MEAEDLSMRPPKAKRIKKDPEEEPMVSVAKALLTLSQTTTTTTQPINLQKSSSSHQNLPAFVPQCTTTPLRPIPVHQTPLRPLQLSNRQRVVPPPPPYSAHPLPWIHRPTPAVQAQNEPENLSVRLPQHPVAISSTPSSTSSAFLQLQSPTLSSTCRSPLTAVSAQTPLREIQSNRQQQHHQLRLSLPQEPVPRFLPQHCPPPPQHFLPLPSPNSVSSLSPSENISSFAHPSIRGNIPAPSQPAKTSSQSKKSKANKPYSCDECRKAFSTQSGYDKHKQLHCNNQVKLIECNNK